MSTTEPALGLIKAVDGDNGNAYVKTSIGASFNTLGEASFRVYNAKGAAYGALGDNATNDAAAIQAAINACQAAGGGIVHLPKGRFVIGSSLLIAGGVTLRGAGKYATVIVHNAAGYALDFNANVATTDIGIQDLSIECGALSTGGIRIGRRDLAMGGGAKERCVLRDLSVRGSASSNPGTVGISLTQIAQSLLQHVEVKSFETGLLMDRTTANVATRVRVWYCKFGVVYSAVAGFGGDSGGIELAQFLDILGPDVAGGVSLKIDGAVSVRNVAPYYEHFASAITVKATVWLTNNAENYTEIAGRYDYTAGPTVTNGLLIDAGCVNARFIGSHGAGASISAASIGAPGAGVYTRHQFLECDRALIVGWAIANGVTAGRASVVGPYNVGASNNAVHWVSDDLLTGGRILVSYPTAPTAVAGAQAGTGPPAPVVAAGSTDTAGQVTFGTGTGPSAGAMVVVTFAVPFPSTPTIVLTPNNSTTALLGGVWAVSAASAGGFTAYLAGAAPAASQANTVYGFNWHAIGKA